MENSQSQPKNIEEDCHFGLRIDQIISHLNTIHWKLLCEKYIERNF
jgi:hypothetical protein